MAAVPDVSVIIPARNAEATIGQTLTAVQRQRTVEVELIVALRSDDEATAAAVNDSDANVRIASVDPEADPSVGAGGQRNIGAALATAPVLAFTDADCLPAPHWLERGLKTLDAADLVQGAILPPPGALVGPFDRTVIVGGESGLFEAANLLVRRELFLKLGGFEDWIGAEESGGRPFGEDAWLGWRARRSGARIKFCREAIVHHLVFPGSPATYVKEHARRRYFPLLVQRIPELRESFCYRHFFLARRTAFFDLAVAGAAIAALSGKRWPIATAMPYGLLLARQVRQAPHRDAARVALACIAADSVAFVALLQGSLKARELLL